VKKEKCAGEFVCVVVLVLYAFGNRALSGAAAVRAGRDSALCALLICKLLFVIPIKLNHQLLLGSIRLPQNGLMWRTLYA